MNREPPIIDMRPDGTFLPPPGRRPVVPISGKLFLGAVLVAVVGTAVTVAALAIWVVSMLLPVIVLAGGFAYLMYRYRRWQSVGRQQVGPRRDPRGFGQ